MISTKHLFILGNEECFSLYSRNRQIFCDHQ